MTKMKAIEPEDWGTPGYFTEEQYVVFVSTESLTYMTIFVVVTSKFQ